MGHGGIVDMVGSGCTLLMLGNFSSSLCRLSKVLCLTLKDICFPDTTPKIFFRIQFKHDYVFNLIWLYSKEVWIFLRCLIWHLKNPIWCNRVEVLSKILPKEYQARGACIVLGLTLSFFSSN